MGWATPVFVVLLSATLYSLFTTTTQLATNGLDFLPFYPPTPPELSGVLEINDKLTTVKQIAKGLFIICLLCWGGVGVCLVCLATVKLV